MEPTKKGMDPSQGFHFPKTYHKEWIEVASSATSVACYHPLRSIAAQMIDRIVLKEHKPLSFSPKVLYKGFSYGCMGAHQLFFMGFLGQKFKQKYSKKELSLFEKVMIGALAGFITTATITPVEVLTYRKQKQKTQGQSESYPLSTLYRGVVPQAMRQIGLGMGMFTLPEVLTKKTEEWAPDFYAQHPLVTKMGNGFFAGVLTAVCTQVPEIARSLMQADPMGKQYPTTSSAIKEALIIIPQQEGMRMFGIRIAVLAVATVTLNMSRETFTKHFNK